MIAKYKNKWYYNIHMFRRYNHTVDTVQKQTKKARCIFSSLYLPTITFRIFHNYISYNDELCLNESLYYIKENNEINKLNLSKMCEQIMEVRIIYLPYLLIYFLIYSQIPPRGIKLLKGIIYLKYQLGINFTHTSRDVCYNIN